jgi:hypothetical protein
MALTITTVTIANGAVESSSIDIQGGTLVGLELPATITGATFSFQHTLDGGSTWKQIVKTDGTVYSITATDDKYIQIPASDLAGVSVIRLISASAEGGARTIKAVTRPV